jgi:hypothetical protein
MLLHFRRIRQTNKNIQPLQRATILRRITRTRDRALRQLRRYAPSIKLITTITFPRILQTEILPARARIRTITNGHEIIDKSLAGKSLGGGRLRVTSRVFEAWNLGDETASECRGVRRAVDAEDGRHGEESKCALHIYLLAYLLFLASKAVEKKS